MIANQRSKITAIIMMLSTLVLLGLSLSTYAKDTSNQTITEKIYDFKVMGLSFLMSQEQVDTYLNSLAYKKRVRKVGNKRVRYTYTKKVFNELKQKKLISSVVALTNSSEPNVILKLTIWSQHPKEFSLAHKLAELGAHLGGQFICRTKNKKVPTICTISDKSNATGEITLSMSFYLNRQETIFEIGATTKKPKPFKMGEPSEPSDNPSEVSGSPPENPAAEAESVTSAITNTDKTKPQENNEQEQNKTEKENPDSQSPEETNSDSLAPSKPSQAGKNDDSEPKSGKEKKHSAQNQTKEQDLRETAKNGDAQAQYEMGLRHEAMAALSGSEPQAKEAVSWYEKAAKQGHADAQYRLAMMLADGQGTPQDMQQAIDLLEKAAKNGSAHAAYRLAMHHLQGIGVNQSDELALKWFEKAKNLDHSKATYRLAQMYELGVGVNIDKQRAEQLYQLAANQKGQNEHAKIGELNGLNVLSINDGIKVNTSNVPF